MKITIDTNLDELLELWVKHSKKLIECAKNDDNEINKFKILREILVKKGVTSLVIEQIKNISYTVSYSHKGNIIKKVITV